MKKLMNEKGFTLIELLLVVVVMGIMLAVIVPRGQRATTDAKYSLVRQNASELASFGNDWVEQQMLAQDDTQISRSTSTRGDYLTSLTTFNVAGTAKATPSLVWIADGTGGGSGWSNWNDRGAKANFLPVGVLGRRINNAVDLLPETSVEGIIEPGRIPLNPFSQTSVFNIQNNPLVQTAVVPGALACAQAADASITNSTYVAFLFQGTDSQTTALTTATTFHAGMNNTISGLRNGVFMSRYQN